MSNLFVLDADPWLRRARLPYWALAQFRKMRVGDMFNLTDFSGPSICGSLTGAAAVSIERERGAYFLSGIWTLHVGKNAKRRGLIFTEARFRILPGRRLEMLASCGDVLSRDGSRDGMRLAALILRRAAQLGRWAEADGDVEAYLTMHPEFFRGRSAPNSAAEAWLEKLRGPRLREKAAGGEGRFGSACVVAE